VEDRDLSSFASGRWVALVRSAVLLGAGRQEAEDLAQATLLRCYLSWSKVVRADNQEAYVARMLLNEFRHSRRRRWWGERPTAQLPDRAWLTTRTP
jgi:DNA-directed RNA polymerase specialized sigma24 family protein